MTVFLSIFNQMDSYLVQNRKENCHHDHIPFNVKENGNIVFSVKLGLIFTAIEKKKEEKKRSKEKKRK